MMVKLFLRKIISFVLDFLVFCPSLWLLYKIMFECMCQWKGGVCLPPPHSGENEPVSLQALHLWPSGLQGNAVILVLPALFAFTTESNNYDSLENLLYLGLQRVPCATLAFSFPSNPAVEPAVTTWFHLCTVEPTALQESSTSRPPVA